MRASSCRVWLWAGVVSALGSSGCGAVQDEWVEVAHMAGEVMSSFDEASEGGQIARIDMPLFKPRGRFRPGLIARAFDFFIPSAYAAACSTVTFSACDAGAMTKTFGGCNIGDATLDGTVTLTFSKATCE